MKKNTLFTKALFTLVFLLISLLGVAQSPQTFTSSDTFTVPAGVTSVTVEAWGGGGRGGERSGSAGLSGGGGGGAYSRSNITVIPGTTYTVTVGSGSTTTAPGGDSWFINNTTILAKGGDSVGLNTGAGASGGTSGSCIGTTIYYGGNGANGVTGSPTGGGGGGSSAGNTLVGVDATNSSGATASTGGGNGGNGATSAANGVAGSNPGGGGGGAKTTGTGSKSGGSGGNGQVIISWTAPATYCAPTYTNGPGTVDQITNVTLGTLNNNSGASSSPYYTFFNSVTIPNLTPSTSASVSITMGSDTAQYAAVWIDFNQNGTFETSEGIVSVNAGANGTTTINIPIPAGALLGNTRMRVRGGDDSALTTSQACGASNSTYGETEDYIVNIVSLAPPTITSLGSSSGCVGSLITINGTNLTGATPANVTIGGTAVSSITSNSATVLVAIIGAGTTGTVSITTAGGTATSAASFTVNPFPAQPSIITGSSTPCAGTSQTYSVTSVAGVSYTWSFPSGWTVPVTTANSITVTTGANSGNITVTPSNGCGSGTVRTLAVTPSSIPAQTSAITGSATPCIATSQTYSVTNVMGTTYTWIFPTGWSQTAGGTTNAITVTTNGTPGTISVTPSNGCGSGTARTLGVTISTVPAQPSVIAGNSTPCTSSSQTYSVTNVAGTTYNWIFPSGWTQTAGGTTNSITVTVGTNSGNIQVTPSNSCGSGTIRTLATTVSPLPSQPSGIIGDTVPCVGMSKTYNVTNVAGVTYNWSFPVGWTQTAGGTSNLVTVTVGSNSGNVQVTPSNGCGNGTAQTLAITVSATPSQPSTITGSTTPCAGTSQTYSVTNVLGTTYTWSFPVGWTQTAGGTTNAITVTTNGTSGTISVTPSNGCGVGTTQTLTTTVNSVPAQPSTITGNISVCSGTSQIYSVTNVSGITYTWAFPSGWTQTGGGTTNSITVTIGTTSGNITVTPSTSCGSGTTRTLATTVNLSPTITGTTPGSRSGAGTVTLGATASSGTISWYANLTGGVALGTGTSYTTPGIITTTNYYVETNNGTCSSAPRVAVTATVNFPEITVLGNSNIILDEDTSPITTDNTNLGTTGIGVGITKNYTIQNSGTVNLTLGTITIGGLNASEFVVTTAPAASVAPSASTTFSITFTPTALGNRDANVSFVTNDPDENPFNFVIDGTGGTGLIPEIDVRGNGVSIVDGDSGPDPADHTDFGSVTLPSTITRTFTIRNTGTGPLSLTGSPLVLVTGSSDFTVITQPSSNTIASGGNLTFQIRYSPTLTGTAIGLVSINNSDTDESIYDFAIRGAAVVSGREIDIQGNEVSIIDGDTTPSTTDQTDFGITDSTTAIPLTFDIYSYGTNSLTFSSIPIVISGTNASQFTVTNKGAAFIPNGTLAGGAITNFVITFTPTVSTGIKTATVTVNSNDSDEGSYSFDIMAEVKTLAPLTVAPGGITSNLKFWLKADTNIGVVSDNSAISSWEDQTYGGTKNAVSKFAKEPKFQNNPSYNVNFNPVIHFNGSNAMSGGQGFNNSDMFIVIKPTNAINYLTSPGIDVYCGDFIEVNKEGTSNQDVTGFELGNTSFRHGSELIAYNQGAQTSFGVAEISTTKFYSGPNIFNPRKNATFPTVKMDILHNANTLTTSSVFTGTYKDIINTRYWLGRSEFFDASYDGDILEIINYDSRNSDADRNKIETYLAIKYGITLGVNGTSKNYVDSNGTIIYDSGAGFNYNIAGIGRDDKSQLNQKQSKTENTASDITIGLNDIFDTNSNNINAFDADKKFLVWGHNNNTLDAQTPITVDMSTGISSGGPLSTLVEFISIARTWRVIEKGGDVPSVKVSIPSSILTATINPPGDFLMFISDSPVFNPTAEYRIMRMNGTNLETEFDFSGTKYITFGYAPEKTFIRCISFDGINDYLDAGKVLNLNTSFTVSSWIKRNNTNRTILSKRNSTFTIGYDLSINTAGKAEMSWMNGTKQTITSSVVIPAGIWHNIAVSYDGTTAKLYIDGVLDVSKAMSTVPSNTQSFLIAAANGDALSFFQGGIDEVRVWNVALTDKQLRYVMNQEISRDATLTGGTTIPNSITLNDIKSIPWVNLSAYYPMSTYTFTNAKDISNNNYTAALKNLTTVDRQTAPLPYESQADGTWQTASTWLSSSVQDLPNSLSIVDGITPVDWNIVKTSHNVTSTTNKTVLGLMVMSNTLTASSDTKIEVTNYLKLDGKIDLVGMSQLVQTLDCDLDVTTTGSIEKDQKGQANKFNYNYWSSPVSKISNATNNNGYTVAGVMKDGFSTTPRNITWNFTYDGVAGTAGTAVSLARYWLYKFESATDSYANWKHFIETDDLRAGQGFTLKGSGAISATQNYTFVGKPNNGLINSNTVAAGQLLLVGNPYPSALDAYKFIDDNVTSLLNPGGSTDGTLYFWQQAPENNSHVLSNYLGGYALLNKTGGIGTVSPTGINGLGTLSTTAKIPKQYIPVGQGFFVYGTPAGGNIIFNNNQRVFAKETDVTSNSLFRTKSPSKNSKVTNQDDALVAVDPYKKIRLGYNTNNKYHRQVLLGFMEDKATNGIDYGYDGEILDDFSNDMYLLNSDKQLMIEGEGYFDANASYPIGVKTDVEGKVSFVVDEIQNFDAQQKIYIYDDVTKIYNEIQNNPFEVTLPAGENNTRFSLRFKDKSSETDKTLGVEENNTKNTDIKITYIQNENILQINNNIENVTVEKVTLFNILGQSVATWNVANKDQPNLQIPIKNKSTGMYVVKLKTTAGELSKKIMVK
ncbi:MAG: choice-of-anchor D domain-containing protein [Flavobacterium sp.]|nr:choice-of-anchor D domain-containing protein [Flavobacterium sp.]